ncbi:MAG TPA: extracellular solute-binding protein [Chloroflexota bacterium]|nr:extracellular solute-binding protein [Chloroflexota bacterium]
MLAACGTTAAPTSAPAQSTAASSASGWNQVLDQARREGHISIIAQNGASVTEALTAGFKAAYPDIQVDYNGASGGDMTAKLLEERRAGRYTTDVLVQGTNTILNDLLPPGAVDPLPPYLVGPDDSNPSVWRGGQYTYCDASGQYALAFLGGAHIPLIYNPTLVLPSDFHSYRDLLDPKWKGKIAMFDPQVAGSGIATAIFLYATPGLGKDFLTSLFQQGVALTRDDRQLTDWVARGIYPIGFSAQDFSAIDLQKKGVPIAFLDASALKEGTYLTSSWGNLGVVNKAPHPNAAKVYLNWLLSKGAQEAAANASGYPSRRQDVSTAGLSEHVVPKADARYDQDSAKEDFWKYRAEVTDFVKILAAK